MTLSRVKKLTVSALVTIMAIFGLSASPALAQHRGGFHGGGHVWVHPGYGHFYVFNRGFYPGYPYWYNYGYYYPYNSVAYQQESGFHDGITRGKSDAEHGKADDPSSHKHYRNSESLAYRNAFLKGYNEGYRDYVRG